MIDQVFEIIRVGVLATATILIILVVIGLLMLLQWVSSAFSPRKKDTAEKEESSFTPTEQTIVEPETDSLDDQQEDEQTEIEKPRQNREEIREKQLRPIYDKYPRIYQFEILYWRGVSKPWWWNNYAKDLLEYVEEYFPINKVNFFATYNSNSTGVDYNNPSYQRRILFLRTKKVSKHPLVSINHDQEILMINSYAALEEMKDRIDAEWYRHYKFKKTYRDSPIEF